MTIDALEYAQRLQAAGISREQAEAIAGGLRDAVAPQLASKIDLDNAVVRLEARIATETATLKTELIKLIIGQGTTVAGIVIAASRLLK